MSFMLRRGPDWVPLCQREKVNLFWLACICTNQLAASLIWTPVGLLTNPLTKKMGLNTIQYGFIQMIGGIVGIIVPPIVGAFSDVTTLSWGRRRVWMIGGEILTVIGFIVLVVSGESTILDNLNKAEITVLFVVGQVLCSVGGNTFNGPGRTLASDLCPPHQQVVVSNICNSYGAVAGIFSNLVTVLEIYKNTSLSLEHFSLLISCVFGFFFLCVSVISAPEERLVEKKGFVNPWKVFVAAFHGITKLEIAVVAGAFFFQFCVNQLAPQSANFFAVQIFNGTARPTGVSDSVSGATEGSTEYDDYDSGTSFASLLSLIMTVIQFVFSVCLTPVVNFIGFKWTWVIGMACATGCCCCFGYRSGKDKRWFYLLAYILQAADQAIGNSVTYAMMSILAHKDRLASMLSLIIFFGNVSGGILTHFLFTIGLAQIPKFQEDTGWLIFCCFPFGVLALLVGLFFFPNRIGKNVEEAPGLDDEEVKDNV